jgi:ribosomal protein L37AE/L43A
MSKKHDYENGFEAIRELERKLEEKKSKLARSCTHCNKEGKAKLRQVNDSIMECKKCGTRFSVKPIKTQDLEHAVMVVRDAINQSKISATSSDEAILERLGACDYYLGTVLTLYKNIVNNYGRGKKKKKKDRDSYGQYGSNIRFR